MPKRADDENEDALRSDVAISTLFDVRGKVVVVSGGGSGLGAMMATAKLSSQRVGLVSLDCVPCQNSEFSALFTVSIFPWPESSYRRQKRSAVLEADGGGHGGGHGPAKWPKT